jgi:hypothetical protein
LSVIFSYGSSETSQLGLKWTISSHIYPYTGKDEYQIQLQARKMPQIAILWAIWNGQNNIKAMLNLKPILILSATPLFRLVSRHTSHPD